MKLLSRLTLSLCLLSGSVAMAEDAKSDDAKTPESIHGFKVKSLDGEEVDLSKYKDKVLLVVNVASRCGATPQYKNLQGLHDKFGDKGLVVMGFPCNQFGDRSRVRTLTSRNFVQRSTRLSSQCSTRSTSTARSKLSCIRF